MNARKIREDLGRVKASCQRRDFPRAVYLTIAAFKELGGQTAPTDLRGDFRNALTVLTSDPQYKKECGQPLNYQPGKERELLIFSSNCTRSCGARKIRRITKPPSSASSIWTAASRRASCSEPGQGLRSRRQLFAEALKYYKNEFSVFSMMARAMLEAGEYVRALGHVRKGLKERPKTRNYSSCRGMPASDGPRPADSPSPTSLPFPAVTAQYFPRLKNSGKIRIDGCRACHNA